MRISRTRRPNKKCKSAAVQCHKQSFYPDYSHGKKKAQLLSVLGLNAHNLKWETKWYRKGLLHIISAKGGFTSCVVVHLRLYLYNFKDMAIFYFVLICKTTEVTEGLLSLPWLYVTKFSTWLCWTCICFSFLPSVYPLRDKWSSFSKQIHGLNALLCQEEHYRLSVSSC